MSGEDTYVFAANTPEADGRTYRFGPGIATFVACDGGVGGEIVGMYKLVVNYRDLGSHASNASFMVSARARGKGVGPWRLHHNQMRLPCLLTEAQRKCQLKYNNPEERRWTISFLSTGFLRTRA